MISLAGSLSDPNFALFFFLPSLWAFLFGVIFSGTSSLALASSAQATELHFGNAQEAHDADFRMSEILTNAGGSISPGTNPDFEVAQSKSMVQHDKAAKAWKRKKIWRTVAVGLQTLSALCFLTGFGWPLFQLSFLGKTLVP
jgi:hypothetical protein